MILEPLSADLCRDLELNLGNVGFTYADRFFQKTSLFKISTEAYLKSSSCNVFVFLFFSWCSLLLDMYYKIFSV